MIYGISRLERQAVTGNIMMVVLNIYGDHSFSIVKFISPVEPPHMEEYRLCDLALKGPLEGSDLQKFNNLVKALAAENEKSLIKAGMLNAVTKMPE